MSKEFIFKHTGKKGDYRNCRCCLSSYERPINFWCELPLMDDDGTIVKPVGFCEFCDKNNLIWYIPNLKCHETNK